MEAGDSDGAPLVLLHGPTDSWRSFEPLLAELPPEVHAFALTQRGHAGATGEAARYAPVDLAADLVAFMDAIGLYRATVLGHSGAGFTAQSFARHHPDRAQGLILLATPYTLAGNEAFNELLRTVAKLRDPLDPDFVREFVTGTTTEAVPSQFLDTIVEEALKLPVHTWRGALYGLLQAENPGAVPHIEAPALLLWGDRDELCTPEDLEALLAALPDARLAVVHGAGHSPHWEDPRACAAQIARFSRAVREG